MYTNVDIRAIFLEACGMGNSSVASVSFDLPPCKHSLIRKQASKRPNGPFGAKPARASAFIGVSILMDTEALAGFAMPARASAFDRF